MPEKAEKKEETVEAPKKDKPSKPKIEAHSEDHKQSKSKTGITPKEDKTSKPKAEAGEKKTPPTKSAPKKKEEVRAAPKKIAKKPVKSRKEKPALDIGIDVEMPKKECKDHFCPFHGTLPVRGQILEGIVISDKMQKSVVVKREYMRLNKKYERLEKRSGKYLAHSPPCQEVKEGDRVRIMECRPLSKHIAYVVIENRG